MIGWLYLLIFLYIIYKFAIVPVFHWKRLGVPHHAPFPFVGNFFPVIAKKTSFFEIQDQIYKEFKKHRYSGFYQLTSPTLYIHDVELIKQIGVKDFDHFVDHRPIGTEADMLLFKNLFSLKGNEWRKMRAFLSPAFTASKMKGMAELMTSCANRVVDYYLQMNEPNLIELELKDVFTRYANDVIATCAFGLECDSLKDRNNEFYLSGKDATNFGGWRGLKLMMANFAPELCKLFKMRMFSTKVSDFFINLITDTIAYREKHKTVRPDIVHLLLEARKGKLKHENIVDENDRGFAIVEESKLGKEDVRLSETLTDLDIASQCFIFFFAGFDTASTLLCFALSEMAINPETQEKLFDEIQEVMQKNNNKPGYDAIMKMSYLDCVISETLRKWPPGPTIDRICTKEYTIEPKEANEVPLTLKVGDMIAIPILGLHRDAQYFPNPDRFDPERFSEENKDNIVPYSYLPFGVGPRACIGSRFALLEAKIILIHLLHNFEVSVIDKTVVPIVLTTKSLQIAPDGGFWVGLKQRKTI